VPLEPDTEAKYRRAVPLWNDRELIEAVQVLEEALADSPGRVDDAWWGATTRALAQIAMELDDQDRAEESLRRLRGSGVDDAQTLALRAKRQYLLGNSERAALEVSVAVGRLAEESEDDVATLMNGAIALIWCAEVLVELGFAKDAADLVDRARERTARAGINDEVLETVLTLVDAEAALLLAEGESATADVDAVDMTVPGEEAIRVTRLRARLAWKVGDDAAAQRHYDDAIAASETQNYLSLARLLSSERQVGPPQVHQDPDPVERWAMRESEQLIAGHIPYAVIVRLVANSDSDTDRFLGLMERVADLLEASPSVGIVDGFGAAGSVQELFLDGDDPDALWAAVKPLVEAIDPPSGSGVEVRQNGGLQKTALG